MTEYVLEPRELSKLRGKVIIVTGAGAGIGKSIVDIAHGHGAKVAACDIDQAKVQKLQQQYQGDSLFDECDVSSWDSVLAFFKKTYNHFGRIDAVVSNAGIHRQESLDIEVGPSGDPLAPDLSAINVNAIGAVYVTRCAVHFFDKHPESASQLIFVGSVASFIDTPPLYTYCLSKAGVLGLMRALRTQVMRKNISVNLIAPWMTVTGMLTDQFKAVWDGLPQNSPDQVAPAALLPVVRPEVNGKSFFVAGGKFIEVEDKLDETQSIWLGEQLDRDMREGQRRIVP